MYKIKNMTNGKLFINDLGLKIPAGETIDLDEMFTRDKIDKSAHLKVAENGEFIAVLHKDVQKESIDPELLLAMEERIKQKLTDEKLNAQKPTDMSEINNKIDALINAFKSQPINTVAQNTQIEVLPEDSIELSKLVEVHAKAMQRISKNTSGNVQASESVVDSDISKNIDELSDLI